ncbi:NAD-dependent epimerase/dehydratase family protein [Candidatus Peregrinibacteria bacterium]|nr:NAD-dependent epimerase/dehydratase family protein [Candidatus Peregrinibacteria bacterium]
MSKKENVLVTGASGFIGARLCDTLLRNDLKVYGMYHANQDRIKTLKKNKNFQAVCQNIADAASMNRLMKKIKPKAVFHAAAYVAEEKNPQPFFTTNVIGTLNILEACRLNNVRTIIHSSSMSVYGNKPKYLPVDERHPLQPYDFYSLSKKTAEDICDFYAKNHNINIIVLRYSGVFGQGRDSGAVAHFIKSALLQKPLSIQNNINWDIIDVNDVAEANFQAYKQAEKLQYELINIGRGQEINIIDLAKKIIVMTQSKSQLTISPLCEKNPYRFYFDITKAKKLLHFKPENLNACLKRYIDFLAI